MGRAIKSLLVANRGEIACRIFRTCAARGIKTVAVASDVDALALHARQADQTIILPGQTAIDTYLNTEAVIDAALRSGVDAIHPGYGFLSEDADFAERVFSAGIIWVGPPPAAIRAMGLKDIAKATMAKAGVPVVPGCDSDIGHEALRQAAEDIGFPVLLKAVAGGGGKGMRLVEHAADFDQALEVAKSEAQRAFGNPAVLVEKYISKPRHIEVQILSDAQRTYALYERDCTLQRRHQKIIEEAPAPELPDDLRTAMFEASIKAANAVDYRGAGTIEFIVDASGALNTDTFYFMEMNTRLQVEHPVTEAILDLDLVDLQIDVAEGSNLPERLGSLNPSGHAIEARLYAENPSTGFLPDAGTLACLEVPEEARFDTGFQSGDLVSPFYDPMLGKIVVHGPNRDVALSKMAHALGKTEIAGVATNRDLLLALVQHASVQTLDYDTQFVEAHLDTLVGSIAPLAIAAAFAAFAFSENLVACDTVGFSLHTPHRRLERMHIAGHDVEAFITFQSDGVLVLFEGTSYLAVRTGERRLVVGDDAFTWFRSEGEVALFGTQTLRVQRRLHRSEAQVLGQDGIAPMPGVVVQVHAKAGDDVIAGAAVLTMEAMKMQHVLRAGRAGVVADLTVQDGDQVLADQTLFVIENAE